MRLSATLPSGGGRRLDWERKKREREEKKLLWFLGGCDLNRLPKGQSQQGDLFPPP